MSCTLPPYLEPLVAETLGLENDTARMLYNPAFHLPVKVSIDGDMWCVLFGENLQDGVAGFGKSPDAAFHDFQRAWYEKLPDKREEK